MASSAVAPAAFVQRPVEVEAIQVPSTSKQWGAVANWVRLHDGRILEVAQSALVARALLLSTPLGPVTLKPGDWIVLGAGGKFHRVSARAFTSTYVPASQTGVQAKAA